MDLNKLNLDKLKTNKHVLSFKDGLEDIKTVVQEGNFKLFLYQLIAVLLVFLLFRGVSSHNAGKIQAYRGKMEAIQVQKENADEYEASKRKLMMLEPRFPDISKKDGWLQTQVLSIFQKVEVTPEIAGAQTENAENPSYVVVSLPASVNMEFNQFANLLADLENQDDLIKVSSITLEKETDLARLGSNKISLKFNTVFPKERIGKKLFTDYDALIAAQKQSVSGGEGK